MWDEDEPIMSIIFQTEINLVAMREASFGEQPVFPATQIINSLVGLLILPQQSFYDMIPNHKIRDLNRVGWRIPTALRGEDTARSLNRLARRMRNAVAHSNLEFTNNAGQISGVRFWDSSNRFQVGSQPEWEIYFSIDELEWFLDRFIMIITRAKKGDYSIHRNVPKTEYH